MAEDKKTLELQIRIAAGEALRAVSSLKGEMSSLAGEARKFSESDGAAIKRTFEQTQAAAEKAAASMRLFGASGGELQQMQSRLKTAVVDLVVRGFDPQSEEVRKLTGEYERLGREAEELDRAAGKNIGSFGDLKDAMSSLAQVAALTKALTTIRDMGTFALSTADTFRTARNEFGVLLGDMEAGAGLFNRIKAFNDKTPFSLDTLTQAAAVLLSAKVPLADLQNQLTRFGDLSQGSSQKFTNYITAFSRAAAKGKADMEILNRYLDQGIPILDTLAKRFNITTEEIAEMASQGEISFGDFSAVLGDLAAEGGQYFGNMELGSQGLAAMQEGLKESVDSLAASFGEMLLPAAINVLESLTNITDAVNESPIAKGALAGALVAVTGYLAAMAVKAAAAFAAQMSLNLAAGALHPAVLATTIAVAGLAAGYAAYASKQQEAAREAENFALQQRRQKDALNDSADALQRYSRMLGDMSDTDLARNTVFIQKNIDAIEESLGELEETYRRAAVNGKKNLADYWSELIEQERKNLDRARADLAAALEESGERRADWIKSMFSGTQAGKIQKINEQLALARKYLTDPGLGGEERAGLQEIIQDLTADLKKLTETAGGSMSEIDRMAARWKETWAGVWGQFQAEQSMDPFAGVELERGKKLADAHNNYVREANKETIDQINAYYDAKRTGIINSLKEKEERMLWELTETRVDDLAWEMQEELKNIGALESQRVIAAAGSEEEIRLIHERAAAMRAEVERRYGKETADALAEDARRAAEAASDPMKSRLEEARAGIADWQQSLADSFSLALMNIEGFSSKAAVILGDLGAQFIALFPPAALSGLEEFGRALGEGEEASTAMTRALAEMAQQILRQLPMLFLQAGLQLIANDQWPLGLGFIAAAGSTAIISGYVDGAISTAKEEAKENAKGGVYGQFGRAAREFAAGGAFTNRIVSRPTYFRYGDGFSPGLGLMGEAGPEAIMPLTRGGDGRLGVNASGISAGGAAVYVIIQNYTNEEVRTEESSGSDGSQIRKIIIGTVKQSITGGEMDQSMSSRYGLRARGV